MLNFEVNPYMKDNSVIKFPDDKIKNADKTVKDMLFCLSTFRESIQKNELTKSEIYTMCGLTQSYLDSLSNDIGYTSMAKVSRDSDIVAVREANIKIKELETKIGERVDGESFSAAAKKYEDVFTAWYEAEGFNYAADTTFRQFGIDAELTGEMNLKENDRPFMTPYCANYYDSVDEKIKRGWDIEVNKYNGYILLTDNNIERFTELATTVFLDALISNISSRRTDSGKLGMRVHIIVPYSNLDKFFTERIQCNLVSLPKR